MGGNRLLHPLIPPVGLTLLGIRKYVRCFLSDGLLTLVEGAHLVINFFILGLPIKNPYSDDEMLKSPSQTGMSDENKFSCETNYYWPCNYRHFHCKRKRIRYGESGIGRGK